MILKFLIHFPKMIFIDLMLNKKKHITIFNKKFFFLSTKQFKIPVKI